MIGMVRGCGVGNCGRSRGVKIAAWMWCAGGDKDDSRLSIHSRSRLVWLRIPRILYSIELLAIEFEARGRWRYNEKGCSGCEGQRGKRKNERRAWFVGVCVCVCGGWLVPLEQPGASGKARERDKPANATILPINRCEFVVPYSCVVFLRVQVIPGVKKWTQNSRPDGGGWPGWSDRNGGKKDRLSVTAWRRRANRERYTSDRATSGTDTGYVTITTPGNLFR